MTSPTLLGTGGHAAGGESYVGKYYANIGLGRCPTFPGGFTTEAYVSQTIRVPGTVSYLSWRLDAPFGSTLTLTLNKNSSATALAISVSAVTGWVTDSTDVVNVSNGDTLDFAADVGSETSFTHSFYCVSARFDATSGSAQMLAAAGSSDDQFAPGTTPQFVPFLGIAAFPSQTETDKQVECLAAGTWQNMGCYLGSNGFNRATTITNRKNGSNGLMAVSIPSFVSGSLEDVASSNKDRVNAGDLLDYQFVASDSGNGASFELAWIGAHCLFSSLTQSMIGGSPVSPSRIPSLLNLDETTYESSLFGGGNPAPSIPRATGLLP